MKTQFAAPLSALPSCFELLIDSLHNSLDNSTSTNTVAGTNPGSDDEKNPAP